MVWLMMLSCRSQEPVREPRCTPEMCLDEYLFSEDAYDNTEALGYMIRYPWHLVTDRQKDRLIRLARPPAQTRTVENIALLSNPTDVVFLDRLIRTGLSPDTDDIPTVCAGTPIYLVSNERNPYCVTLIYQVNACRRSVEPVCAGYREMSTDWADRSTDFEPWH